MTTLSGGHNKECAVNPATGRCKASEKADGNCENNNGRCRRRRQSKKKKMMMKMTKQKNAKTLKALKRSLSDRKRTVPSKFQKLVEKCDALGKEWRIRDHAVLGKGMYGKTYIVCREKSTNCEYVLKIQKKNGLFYDEVLALSELQETGVVPRLYAAWTCKSRGFIVMEKLETLEWTADNLHENFEKLKATVAAVHDQGWLHMDLHPGNVMKRKGTGEIVLLDFGMSVKRFGSSKHHSRNLFIMPSPTGPQLWSFDQLKNSELYYVSKPRNFLRKMLPEM